MLLQREIPRDDILNFVFPTLNDSCSYRVIFPYSKIIDLWKQQQQTSPFYLLFSIKNKMYKNTSLHSIKIIYNSQKRINFTASILSLFYDRWDMKNYIDSYTSSRHINILSHVCVFVCCSCEQINNSKVIPAFNIKEEASKSRHTHKIQTHMRTGWHQNGA